MGVYISEILLAESPVLVILLPDGQGEIKNSGVKFRWMPVPSHGELIDRDALLESEPEYTIPNYNSDGYLADADWAYTSVQIEDAPTIIPADVDKDINVLGNATDKEKGDKDEDQT